MLCSYSLAGSRGRDDQSTLFSGLPLDDQHLNCFLLMSMPCFREENPRHEGDAPGAFIGDGYNQSPRSILALHIRLYKAHL
jgi:hypothetical protein